MYVESGVSFLEQALKEYEEVLLKSDKPVKPIRKHLYDLCNQRLGTVLEAQGEASKSC